MADPVPQPVDPVENNSKIFLEHSLQSKEIKKINGVPFRYRMTKKRHKKIKVPKLPFRKTEPNELADPVSQPFHPVERGSKNFSEPLSKS